MVADSITDSELFHGRPISRDFVKKRKANWFWKLKQWKIDARRKQWIYQWKRANPGEDENGSRLKSLREKLITHRNTASDRFSHEEGSYDDDDDDDENELERASSASSPTSVLKNKDSDSNKSGDDCFCCSKQVTEEDQEEAFDDAFDNFDGFIDALNFFEQQEEEDPKLNPSSNQESSSSSDHEQKECDDEKSECPICSEEMDETDLSFTPCPCGFRLCLFCHNKINENDGRCPACRNKYGKTTSSNHSSRQVSFQQRGRGTLRLSPSFRGLDRA